MPVPVLITDLSQTAASNFPAGSNAPSTLDDTQRAHGAFIAQLRDGKGFTSSSTVASAATTDIGAQNSLFVDVTGTTTITSFGTTYNGPRFLRFAAALTLTHNSTSLILPGGANITTAAGDTLVAIPKTTGVTADGWTVVSYQKNSGVNVSASDLQAQTYTAFNTAGTSTAYTLTPAPAITGYVAGQSFDVTFHVASGAAPTLQINGIATPPNLVKQIGAGTYANIEAGDIPLNHRSRVTLLSATQALLEKVTISAAGVAPRATRIDVASVAGTVDLTANAPNTDDIRITGALAITAFTIAIGRVIRVTAGGAFILTNNASIVTQTGANVIAASGDTFMLRATAANIVEILSYVKAPKAGDVLQMISFASDAGGSSTSGVVINTTASSKLITPKSTNSIIVVTCTFEAKEALLAATNTIGTFQLMESSTAFGNQYTIGITTSGGGQSSEAPAAITGRVTNAALTVRDFTLGAATSNASAAASATNQMFTIIEIQA